MTFIYPERSTTPLPDSIGYFPIVGQGVGLVRTVSGLVYAIFCFAAIIIGKCINEDVRELKNEVWDGIKHFGRGIFELIPIIGGIATYIYDNKFKQYD